MDKITLAITKSDIEEAGGDLMNAVTMKIARAAIDLNRTPEYLQTRFDPDKGDMIIDFVFTPKPLLQASESKPKVSLDDVLIATNALDNTRLPIGLLNEMSSAFSEKIHGAEIPEKPPIQNNYPAVWDLVISDMKTRDQLGTKKYRTRLQPFNGRDQLWDAYQEALDLVVYLRNAIYERDNPQD